VSTFLLFKKYAICWWTDCFVAQALLHGLLAHKLGFAAQEERHKQDPFVKGASPCPCCTCGLLCWRRSSGTPLPSVWSRACVWAGMGLSWSARWSGSKLRRADQRSRAKIKETTETSLFSAMLPSTKLCRHTSSILSTHIKRTYQAQQLAFPVVMLTVGRSCTSEPLGFLCMQAKALLKHYLMGIKLYTCACMHDLGLETSCDAAEWML